MIIALIVTVLLFRFCVAAVLSACLARHDDGGVGLRSRQDPGRAGTVHPTLTKVAQRASVNRRVMTLDVPAQDCMTKDQVSVRVDAVVHFRVVEVGAGVDNAQVDQAAIPGLVEASLSSLIGSAELDHLFPHREQACGEPNGLSQAPEHRTLQGSVGPQDAPLPGPRDAAGRPQDADFAVLTIEQSDQRSSAASSQSTSVERASAIAVDRRRGAALVVRAFVAGCQMPLVTNGSADTVVASRTELPREKVDTAGRTLLDSLARPLAGPAFFGGRDDAVYLRGWDDAVDNARRGNEAQGPSWGSAAYMTGWNDGVLAIAKASRR